jgi:delta-1-pyrroline-5-carboxylate synthetase
MHPENDEARIIYTYREDLQISVGEKSARGRGGMQSKIDAAKGAIFNGIPAVVIASGFIQNNISRLMNGENVGTLFTNRMNDPVEELDTAEILASKANQGGDLLRSLTCEDRNNILNTIARNLLAKKDSIFAANMEDLRLAMRLAMAAPIIARLKLSEDTLVSVTEGIIEIANAPDPIGKIISVTEISEGLILTKETTPLGVLLAIFESHPYDLPQLAALAIKSGNALLVKGGKESQNTNETIHKILCDSVEEATSNSALKIPRSVIGLVKPREDISTLLALEKDIAMIIPRGSNKLIRDIQKRSRIPVLGHSEGVCHIYVHPDANIEKAIRIIVDAKLDSPSALNSVETVLLNQELLDDDRASRIMKGILKREIVIHGCRRAVIYAKLHDLYLNPLKTTYHHEYNDRQLTVAIVNDLASAIEHINDHGSGHTESIVTESLEAANQFMDGCESACVFHNASTRFADGYRFGVGAEVGISTSRIHARGPVGVEGLLTAKWKLRSSNPDGDIVGEHRNGEKRSYTHKRMSKL